MTWYTRIVEDSPLKRAKRKRDLIKILRKHGFKRSFLKYPASEVYVKGDFKAKIYSKTEHDFSRIPPYNYGVAGVKIHGPTMDSKFDRIGKDLSAYSKKAREGSVKKRKQDEGNLEKRIGVSIAFIIGGIALSLGSLTITGNAVSNLTQTTPGLLGVFLFIAGLVGMFFYFRRK